MNFQRTPRVIEATNFEGERILFAVKDTVLDHVQFRTGESALKHVSGIAAHHCRFMGKYPFWNVEVRGQLDRAINIHEVRDVNPFDVAGLIAAYRHGEPWLDDIRSYVFANYRLVVDFLANRARTAYERSETGPCRPSTTSMQDADMTSNQPVSPTSLVACVAITIAKPDCGTKIRDALERLVPHVRQEKGVIQYDLHADIDDPCRFVVIEKWADRAKFDAHCVVAP